MKSIQFTLYEIFGYCIPGIVAFAGLYLTFWQLFLAPHQDCNDLSTGGWWALLVLAYILGHSVQALSNVVFDKDKRKKKVRVYSDLPAAVKTRVQRAAKDTKDMDSGVSLSAETVFEIAKCRLLQHGKTEVREIYIYREGFYRGMAVASLLLAVGLFFRFISSDSTLSAVGIVVDASGPAFLVASFVAVSMSPLFRQRYERFLEYRIKYIYYSLLALEHPVAVPDE